MAVYQEARGIWTETAAVGPLTEGAAGIAAIVLCVIGLASIAPASMAAIAIVIIAAGLIVEGANTAVEYSRAMMRAEAGAPEVAELGADITAEFMAGGAGMVLGVLSLVGVNEAHLMPASLIVFGGALVLAGLSATRIGAISTLETVGGRTVAWRSELSPSRGLQMLIGAAAVVLGILALVLTGMTVVLSLVGLLAVGAALLATSANFTRALIATLAQ
jgi:hypothetical protein